MCMCGDMHAWCTLRVGRAVLAMSTSAIHTLNLSGNSIGPSAGSQLAVALEQNTQLTKLNLAWYSAPHLLSVG